jgi:hypothetical protein
MRSGKKTTEIDQIDGFWKWFSSAARLMSGNVENRTFADELDRRMREFDPKLSWEIGPGATRLWQLVISPNLDRELREKARVIVARAPEAIGWKFHSARQPKNWNYQFEIGAADRSDLIRLDASNWTFVLLKYPNGAHEVLLRSDDVRLLTEDERWQAAAIVLESILGEELVMDKISEFELLDELEPRFALKQRPIQDLRIAFAAQ